MRVISDIVPTLGEASDSVIRYLVLVNAGGAAASLSFYGVVAEGTGSKFILFPLTCFVLGLIMAGLIRIGDIYAAIDGMITAAEQHGGDDTADELISGILTPLGKPIPQAVRVWRSMLRVGIWAIPGSFILFCIGALLGVLGLAVS